MEETERSSPEGLWNATGTSESVAVERLEEALEPFLEPLIRCYEAGVQVVTLPASNQGAPHLSLSALFLKRALTDLRAVWLLLTRGYTSQAASVAAALLEHALAAVVLAGDPEATQAVIEANGDVPWGAKDLCKRAARITQSDATSDAQTGDPNRAAWEAYCGYKYLCKIKHPTMRSAAHDAGAAVRETAPEEFVVVAVPDVRPQDLPQKALILLISITRVYQAIYQFQRGADADSEAPEYVDFLSRVGHIVEDTIEAAKAVGTAPLPFSVADDPALLAWRKEFEGSNDST